MDRRRFLQRTLMTGGAVALGASGWRVRGGEPPPPPVDLNVKRVLAIWKCHLDVGFAGTQAEVQEWYFDVFYPKAIQTGLEMRKLGSDRFVWTTGSWLLYQYLEKADATQRKEMDEAVGRGDIAWHALPFSWQSEFMDRSLIEASLNLSKTLDERYGRTTIGAKMTDVCGHTRGLISPLARSGVTFLDIGANALCSCPQVPPLCNWKNAAGESIMLMYHPGYGGNVTVPNSDLAISINMRGDNSGPHSVEELKMILGGLRKQYPNAEITTTNLSEIARALEPYRAGLPVVTAEIGDTWIYGVASDPVKTAQYREFCRLRRKWIGAGRLKQGEGADLGMIPLLGLSAEHTWGLDTKLTLDYDHYTPVQLAEAIETPPYRRMELSWQEKRLNLMNAIGRLPPALQREARQALDALNPVPPVAKGLAEHAAGEDIATAHFVLALDPATGAIKKLRNKTTQRDWASPEKQLAALVYQTISQEQYRQYVLDYTVMNDIHPEIFNDLSKPGMPGLHPESREWTPRITRCWSGPEGAGHRVLAQLQFNDPAKVAAGLVAWPEKIFLEIVLPDQEAVARISLYWFDKAVQRMAESLWLTFAPLAPEDKGWTMNKLGEAVSPFEVVVNGNRHMHAIEDAITYQDAQGKLAIESIDAPVVALGERSPIVFNNEQPKLQDGVHFNLYNNAFGTNYILWFGEPMRYRFNLRA